jgi:hypothetical protein
MSALISWFLPHHENNHKAHLLKSYSLFFLCFTFAFLQVGLNFFLLSQPAVLGFSSQITPERIIELTNKERGKLGLSSLKENKLLSEAARQKAADMFAFNYWAHISPSGRTPWTFFTDVGYKYQYAGENLARDFRDPESVVQAWMDSSTHRENVVNSKYQEIGIAVIDGTLQGVETTLVVQLFGTAYGAPAAQSPKPQVAEKPATLPQPAETLAETPGAGESALSQTEKGKKVFPLTSPFDLTKAIVIFVVGILIGAFAVDILTVSHRETPRLSSRSLAQMLFLIFVLVAGLLLKEGAIL